MVAKDGKARVKVERWVPEGRIDLREERVVLLEGVRDSDFGAQDDP